MTKTITILCQHFYPEEVGTGRITTELAEDLVGYGYTVTVIAGQPSIYHCVRPQSQLLKNNDVYGGIAIYRVFNTMLDKNFLVGRTLNALTFSITAFLKLLTISKKGVLLVYTSPPFLPLAAFLNKLIRRQRYVIVVQDVFPDTAVKLGYFKFFKFFLIILRFIYRAAYNFSEKVVVIGRDIKSTLDKRAVRPEKLIYISNWADGSLIEPQYKDKNILLKKFGLQDKFIVGYSGTLGMPHSFKSVVQAARRLKELPINFLFIAGGLKLEELKSEVKKHSLDNFLFLPFQDNSFLKYALTAADVWLILLKEEFRGLSVPAKLYSYMASGRAIIALVHKDSEVAGVVNESGCGFVVSVDNSEDLTERIELLFRDRQLSSQMGKRARFSFEKKYNRKVVTQQYKELFDSLA